MNQIQTWLSTAVDEPVAGGIWLVLKLTAILGVAWVVHFALRRANPRWRVLAWRMAAVAMLLVAALACLPPLVSVPVLPASPRLTHSQNEEVHQAAAQHLMTDAREPEIQHELQPLRIFDRPRFESQSRAANDPATAPLGVLTPVTAAPPAVRAAQEQPIARLSASPVNGPSMHAPATLDGKTQSRRSIATWIMIVWLIGIAATGLRAAAGLLQVRHIRRLATAVPDRVAVAATRVAAALAIRRRFRVCQSSDVQSPCLCGIFDPLILIPADQADASREEELPSIFAHELAHLRGADVAWNALLTTISLLLWFHPFAWRARRAHAEACDGVSDAVAADYVGDPEEYTRTLARLVLRIRAGRVAVGLSMARRSGISRRMSALKAHVFRDTLSRRKVFCVLSAVGAIVFLLGGLALTRSRAESQPADQNAPAQSPPDKNPAAPKPGKTQQGGKTPADAPQSKPQRSAAKSSSLEPESSNPATNRMTIRLREKATGKPLADAELEIRLRADGKRSQKTLIPKDDGVAVFEWKKSAKVEFLTIIARASGYVPLDYQWGNTDSDFVLPSELDLQFEPGSPMQGVVRDEAGKPIAGAKIEINMPITWPRISYWVFTGARRTTDANGRWTWREAPADRGNINIQASHRDYVPAGENGATGQIIVLNQGLTVRGQVIDHDGKPVQLATVALGFDRFGSNEPQTRTNMEGQFVLKNCKPGRSLVTVQAGGYSPQFQDVTVSKKTPDVNFQLEPGHVLRIRVVDTHGKPLKGVMFAPDTWRGYRSLQFRGNTNANGEFTWKSAPADEMLCDILGTGYMSTRRLPLTASKDVHVITLHPPLVITGHVTDAHTGRPLEQFQVRTGSIFSDDGRVYWSSDEGAPFENGTYRFKFDEPTKGRVLRAFAPGYLALRSRVFDSTGGTQTFDFALESGKGFSGTVVLPDGRPAVDAEVGLATKERRAGLSGGAFNRSQNFAEMVRTDAQGRFKFQPQDDERFRLIVIHPFGFADLSSAEFAKSNRITLQAWGQLKGRVLDGRRPDVNRPVWFASQHRIGGQTFDFVLDFGNEAQTDDKGEFHFDRLVPGKGFVSRIVSTSFGRSRMNSSSDSVAVNIPEGKTVEVTIGGKGRPVVGHVVLKGKPSAPLNWTTCQPVAAMRWDKKKKVDAQPFVRYLSNLSESGEFRIADVPAGDYKLDVSVNAPPNPAQCGSGQAIGSGTLSFTVPAMPGGRSDEPLDLGVITATLFKTLNPGDLVPDFTVERLGGGSLHIKDFRGKFVLLDFWATWCGPCLAEMPNVKAIQKEFGKDARFALIGLSCDNGPAPVKKYVDKNGLDWTHACIGGMGSGVANDYGVRAIPTTFLIAPDGHVLAKDLRGDALKKAIEAALQGRKVL